MPRVPVPGDVRHLKLEFCGPREGLEIIPRILLRGEPGEVKQQGLPPSRRWIGKSVCDLQEGCPLWGQSLITFSSVYKRRLKPWTPWPCLPGKGGSIGPNVHHLVSSPVPVVRGLCVGGLLVAEACEGRVGPPSGPSVTPFPRVGFLSALPAPASNFTLHSPFRLRRASSPLSCSYDHDPVAFPLQRDRASLLSRFPPPLHSDAATPFCVLWQCPWPLPFPVLCPWPLFLYHGSVPHYTPLRFVFLFSVAFLSTVFQT